MPEAQTRLKIAGHTDTGRRRDYNQDHIGFDQELGIAVLADGMGGIRPERSLPIWPSNLC